MWQVVEEPLSGTCPESAPFCVQCGQPGDRGAALCLSSTERPGSCSFDPAFQPPSIGVSDQPLLGDMPMGAVPSLRNCELGPGRIFREGTAAGSLAISCNGDGKTFVGVETLCRNGTVGPADCTAACLCSILHCRLRQCRSASPGETDACSPPAAGGHRAIGILPPRGAQLRPVL